MQIRSFQGSGKPARVIALPSACERLGPDPRRALGPAAIRAASTGRTRDRTRPMLQQRQKVLARAPSTRDPWLCKNSTRYNRTGNFGLYGQAESTKPQKFVFRLALRANQISFSHCQDPERTW